MIGRRKFLVGLIGVSALVAAPTVCRSGILMPVRTPMLRFTVVGWGTDGRPLYEALDVSLFDQSGVTKQAFAGISTVVKGSWHAEEDSYHDLTTLIPTPGAEPKSVQVFGRAGVWPTHEGLRESYHHEVGPIAPQAWRRWYDKMGIAQIVPGVGWKNPHGRKNQADWSGPGQEPIARFDVQDYVDIWRKS